MPITRLNTPVKISPLDPINKIRTWRDLQELGINQAIGTQPVGGLRKLANWRVRSDDGR